MLALTPALLLGAALSAPGSLPPPPAALRPAVERATRALVAKHGEPQRARIERGVRQASAFWRSADGDAKAFEAFALEQFVSDPATLDVLFQRFERAFEQLDGHFVEVNRALAEGAVLDRGPMLPVDPLFAAYDASAHLVSDLFDGKLAFAALLNFPLTTLDERLREGPAWTRRQWAEARLANRFARRVPSAVNQGIARAYAEGDLYISEYNVYMHHALAENGERLFPKGKRLLSHWNLRDELKAQYAQEGGLARQRVIAKVMERIVTQTIPADVVNDPTVDWNPFTNAVRPAPAETIEGEAKPRAKVDAAREPDTRYAKLLAGFRAVKAADPYSPSLPTHIARKFELERELPEARVVAMLEEVLGAPEIRRIAKLVSERLGRPLEPHDIWYDGFRPRSKHTEAELDALTKARYPTPEAFARALPETLQRLGFAPERARWLAERIAVDPARGSGHALGAARRGDKPHLRTRVGPDGMDYKGFNIAVHELGHNVEQVFSLYEVDSTLLQGVPNTAFTEAIAFVFQARDLDVLGLEAPSADAKRLLALNDLWMTYEIAGVALVDIGVWHWMYAHPNASPAALREATLAIAKDVWNRWYAPVFGVKDVTLLAIYSHLIDAMLYLPDYPIGHLIAAQLETHLEKLPKERLGAEIERITKFGAVTPDLWMKNATGEEVSPKPLIRAAAEALAETARAD
ncbi:MAG TPA: hypothetical protein VD838_08865 [Anaeromyxobacteraceae bacterium]|nr:hypothetical protein [Anaeromyxobacteraceae bacterium]